IGDPSHTVTITAVGVLTHISEPAPIRGIFRSDNYSPKLPPPEARWYPQGDYNGDGKTDFTTYVPATGQWPVLINNPGGSGAWVWGQWGGGPDDMPMVGDYNGDGRSDFCI